MDDKFGSRVFEKDHSEHCSPSGYRKDIEHVLLDESSQVKNRSLSNGLFRNSGHLL